MRSGNCRAVTTLRLNRTRKRRGYGNLGGLSPIKKATSRRMQLCLWRVAASLRASHGEEARGLIP